MDSKKLSSQRFAQFSQAYVTSEVHAKGAELDRFIDLVEPRKSWRMLDIATGGGHTALKFSYGCRPKISLRQTLLSPTDTSSYYALPLITFRLTQNRSRIGGNSKFGLCSSHPKPCEFGCILPGITLTDATSSTKASVPRENRSRPESCTRTCRGDANAMIITRVPDDFVRPGGDERAVIRPVAVEENFEIIG